MNRSVHIVLRFSDARRRVNASVPVFRDCQKIVEGAVASCLLRKGITATFLETTYSAAPVSDLVNGLSG